VKRAKITKDFLFNTKLDLLRFVADQIKKIKFRVINSISNLNNIKNITTINNLTKKTIKKIKRIRSETIQIIKQSNTNLIKGKIKKQRRRSKMPKEKSA
jgi:hypothetical protein